jgi:hypothetical protein
MPEPKKYLVVMPAHNECAIIGDTLRAIIAGTGLPVVVIDDASTDGTTAAAQENGAQVLTLVSQLGAWGAIQTGMRYALKNGYENVITIDADGQHDATDIDHLQRQLEIRNADMVIGACTKRGSRARKTAWVLMRLLSGLTTKDLTSGFRAYSHTAMKLLAGSEATTFDYQDVGVLCLIRHAGLKIAEIPVRMRPRIDGKSRIFDSWVAVMRYMLYTSILAISHTKYTGKR